MVHLPFLLLALCTPPLFAHADPPSPPPRVIAGQYLVLLDAPVDPGLPMDRKALALGARKRQLVEELQQPETAILGTFSHLPMIALRGQDAAALAKLQQNPRVRAVYPNHVLFHQLTESLPLIQQTLPAELGYGGQGTTIAIVDTGLDYTRSEFGSCTAPGVPAGCRVAAAVEIAPEDGARDDNGHGTHVGAIAAAVAGDADLVALDVFDGATSSDALVISAINWAIAHQADYNIVAINLSLGDGKRYTSPCGNWETNPYVTAIDNAGDVGILIIAAAGNEGYIDGLSRPACTPDAVSVGAVYDANVGGLAYGSCTDYTTAPNQIACFSNSADFLTLWAPGSLITAAGSIKAGTSQAAPHVAGVAAVLRGAYPQDSVDQTVMRLTDTGTLITDPRNGTTLPRLDEKQALGVTDPAAVPGFGRWAMAAAALVMLFMSKAHNQKTR